MKVLEKTIIVLIIFSFVSCKTDEDEYIFDFERFENLENLKLIDVINYEHKRGSKEKIYNVKISALGYNPQNGNDTLSNPKVFEITQDNLRTETLYFYTKNDGLVKVIFYEWSSMSKDPNIIKINIKRKLNKLKAIISKKLGQPKDFYKLDYVDRYEWSDQDLTATLYFDYSASAYTKIRLEVYNK